MMSQCKVRIVSALLSVDSVHQSCADVSTRYKAQAVMGLCHRVEAFQYREKVAFHRSRKFVLGSVID